MKRFIVVFSLASIFVITGFFIAFAWTHTPNDPEYNCSEKNWVKHPLFTEQTDFFGFAPKFSRATAKYVRHPFDKSLDGKPQISGSSVDKAWEIEKGDPEIIIGVIECDILWNDIDANYKLYINKDELAKFPPDWDMLKNIPVWDTNKDGRFSIEDYEPELKEISDTGKVVEKVKIASVKYLYKKGGYNGHPAFFKVANWKINFFNDPNSNGLLDPQDLIKTFSNNIDEDGNGFIDDISGWDFFDDDNDPADSSSTALSQGHGTGQVRMAAGKTNNGFQAAGVCPECTALLIRGWDSFAMDTSYYGLAAMYAANQGASVILGAMGGINNAGICRDIFKYII